MLQNAKALAGPDGKLIVGILTDKAVTEKKPKPITNFDDRINLARSIKYVDIVVAQETYSPLPNVLQIRPDILCESTSHSKEAIRQARKVMNILKGKVVVVPYYPDESSTSIKNKIKIS